ncbi:MAG TPA: hypothetical protein VG323_04700, partial [Thermoanaerobaculia bacterium]|nr:hypothetical protein [Thermoanaerobaculia bacterium]
MTVSPPTVTTAGNFVCSNGWSTLVDGTYEFVGDCQGDGRIVMFDLTNPKAPVRLRDQATLSTANVSYTQLLPYGNYLVGISPNSYNGGHDVVVIDRRDINNLVTVANLDIPNFAGWHGVIAGSTLYTVSLTGQMSIVDLSNPASPVVKSTINTVGLAANIAIAGNVAIVADGSAGVSFYDVTSPAAPKLIGSQPVGGNAWDVKVWGNKLYVANEQGVVTLTGLVAPPVVNTGLVSIARTGSGATVTGAAGAVNGNAPLTLTIHDESNSGVANATGVAVSADGSFTATIAAGSGDVLDVTATDGGGRSSNVTVIGSVPFGSGSSLTALPATLIGDSAFRARRLALDGTWMTVQNFPASGFESTRLAVLDMTSGTPVYKQTIILSGNARDLTMRNGVAYSSDTNYHINVVDMTVSPATATTAGNFVCSNGWSVLVDGTYAYAGDCQGDGRIDIFDMTNPKVPVKLRDQATLSTANVSYTQLLPYGSYLVGISPNSYNGGHDVVVIDRRDINNLVTVANLDIPNFAGWHGVIAGSTLYTVSLTGQMSIVDLTNPASPVVKSTINTVGLAANIAIAGKVAIVADGSAGVSFYDVTSPAAPKLIGTEPVGGNAWDVNVWNDTLYVANEEGIVTLPNVAIPPTANVGQISVIRTVTGARVTGTAGAIGGAAPVSLKIHDESNASVADTTGVVVNADGSFTATIGAGPGDVLDVTATDGSARTSIATAVGSVPLGSGTTVLLTVTPAADSAFHTRRIASDGTYAVLQTHPANGFDSKRLLVYSPAGGTPQLSQAVTMSVVTRDVVVRNGLAYVADASNNINVVDLTVNPATISRFGTLLCGTAWSIAVDGNYGFVGDCQGDGRIDIFDLTNPRSPVKLRDQGTLSTANVSYTHLLPYGNYLVGISPNSYNGGHDVVVIDRSNINSLATVANMDIPNINLYRGRIVGHTLYAVGDTGVVLVDLTTPSSPTVISRVTTADQLIGLDVDVPNNRLYFVAGTGGETVIDITIPSSPKVLGTQALGGNSWDTLLIGTNLLVASEQMLNVISLTAPTATSLPPVVQSAPAEPLTAPPPAAPPGPPKLRAERGLITVSVHDGAAVVRGSAR